MAKCPVKIVKFNCELYSVLMNTDNLALSSNFQCKYQSTTMHDTRHYMFFNIVFLRDLYYQNKAIIHIFITNSCWQNEDTWYLKARENTRSG